MPCTIHIFQGHPRDYPPLSGDRRTIAYTTSARISVIFSRLTASIVATLILSRSEGERASNVDRYPEPRTTVHQSSGVLSGCVPGSATTTGSVTPHSMRSARSGSSSTILFQGLIDLNSSGFGSWYREDSHKRLTSACGRNSATGVNVVGGRPRIPNPLTQSRAS